MFNRKLKKEVEALTRKYHLLASRLTDLGTSSIYHAQCWNGVYSSRVVINLQKVLEDVLEELGMEYKAYPQSLKLVKRQRDGHIIIQEIRNH